jgi:glycosyltransferase involved in cell wall biosynthesis
MKVSLITVCYNAEATLEDTILSVVSQDYPDIEYILIDGASTDGTADIINRYRDRFTHIVREPDDGIYDAMNKGLALATGDLIGLLNADDIYAHSGVLSEVMAVMQSESLDAVYADVDYFEGDNPEKTVRHYSSAYFKPSRMGWGFVPAHPTLFLRQEIYQRFGHFKTNYRIAGDYDLIARIFKDETVRYRYLPKVLVRMRLGGASTRSWHSMLRHNSEVIRACRENGIYTTWFMILAKYPVKLLGLVFK